MSEFQREDRYIVIKRSDLKKVPVAYRSHLVDPMFSLLSHLPRREFVVVESDWPEFEPVWRMIEARVTGTPPPHPQFLCVRYDLLQECSYQDRQYVSSVDYDALAAQRGEGLAREAELQRRLAEAETQIRLVAHTAGDLLEQVINATELFDEPISDEEIDETNAVIDCAIAFAGPDSADGKSAECAHSYANKLGCPECGEDFGK
jgi:hypothetical protein